MSIQIGKTFFLLVFANNAFTVAAVSSPQSHQVAVSGSCFASQESSSFYAGNSIYAESALVDKETKRIFWEGGPSSTLSESLAPWVVRAKAGLASYALWFAIYGVISTWLRHRMERSSFIHTWRNNRFTAFLIALLKWTLLGTPRLHPFLLFLVVFCYLLEAYTSDTHQYLSSRSDYRDVESYIEKLREEAPQVLWKIRAFHYERFSRWLNLVGKPHGTLEPEMNTEQSLLFRRKCVSHEATAPFKFDSWRDKTTAGVWTRAQVQPSALAKIRLTKVIVLGDRKAREDYFKQQAEFVSQNKKDFLAEFATNVQVTGFKPCVLVVRTRQPRYLFSRRAFWVCTLLGLTAFYRLWIARQCDEIRVAVIKEIDTVNKLQSSSRSSWFSYTRRLEKDEMNNNNESSFQNLMRQLHLYSVSETKSGIGEVVHTCSNSSLNATSIHSVGVNQTALDTKGLNKTQPDPQIDISRLEQPQGGMGDS